MPHKNAVYNVAGNIVFLFAQWLMTIVVVRLSGYYDAGTLSIAITLTGIFYIISNYNMRVFQVADIDNRYDNRDYILARVLTIFTGFFACGISLIFLGYGAASNAVILLYMCYKSFESISDAYYGLYQKSDQFVYICVSMCAKGVVGIVAFTVFMRVTASLSVSLLVMAAAIAFVIFLYDYPRIRKYTGSRGHINATVLRRAGRILVVCLPLMLVMITQPILQAIPRLIFERRYSTELFGIYSSIAIPCAIITLFASCAILPYVPHFASLYQSKDNKRFLSSLGATVGIIVVFGIVALIGAYFLGEWALVLLFGEGVRSYVGVLPYVIIVMICSSLIMVFNGIMTAMHKSVTLLALSLIGCLICAITAVFFIESWQMYGIAYSMIIAQTVQIAAMAGTILFFTRKNS